MKKTAFTATFVLLPQPTERSVESPVHSSSSEELGAGPVGQRV